MNCCSSILKATYLLIICKEAAHFLETQGKCNKMKCQSQNVRLDLLQNSREIPLCGEEGAGECVTSLHPANVDCHGNFCTFPSRSNWMEADFAHANSEQCSSETTLQYWHVCYDCMMHVAAMEAQV